MYNTRKRFEATYADVTPTQWVKNNFSLGLTVASATHIQIMMHRNVDWEVEGAKIPYIHALHTRHRRTRHPTILVDYFKQNPTFLPDHAGGSDFTT